MIQIRFKQKLLGKELVSSSRSTLVTKNRSTLFLNNRLTPTIPRRSTTVQYRKPLDPGGYAKAIDGRTLHVSREDITYILQTANGADNLFMHQRSNLEQKTAKEFYDTLSTDSQNLEGEPLISMALWEEKDEYGVYRDDREFARDLDGHTIPVHNKDIRRLLERASRDEPAYICLLEHASSFKHTKLVPEIYTKDEINEMFYGVCGEHERNKEAFQMKLDGV
ncbi:hypothetical protein F2Q70_00015642 [Brassica cretica]|uniref:Uncharacterized protein n=1 Tax=Brassica cretica TaxID=69181 RepID=A0A8S9HT53_BRACR|nr:hypothetical protein F2Q70_00015642 [Brassica cretica]